MINVKVEDNKRDNYVLKVGDVVISEFNELCFIVETRSPKTYSVIYAIQNVMHPYTFNATSVSLETLTDHAEAYNYRIYPQDQYDLILRHKDIGAVG